MAGGHVAMSPAVVSGRVYVSAHNRTTFDDGTIFCLNASTGTHIWDYTEGGVMWSPTVAGNRVYVGGGREWYTTLFCFDAFTGKLLWRYETDDDISSAAPAVAYGCVYVGDRDGCFYCLDAVTGTLRWRYRVGGDINNNFDLSAPAVVSGRVYVGCQDHQLYCFDALSGTLCWAFTSGGTIDSSPAVVDGRVYVGSVDAKVYCLDASTGAHLWDYTTDGYVISSPAIAHGRVYVGSARNGHRLYCLNATTGAQIWSYKTDGAVYGSPSVAGTRVYVGSYDTRIYCLDAETGAMLWTYKTGDYVSSSPAIVDGRVYIGSFDATIYVFGSLTTMYPFDVDGAIFPVSVESNSQISDVSLDQPLETISFTATGTPGTPSFVNMTIPNAFLKPDSVLVDGSPVTPIKTSNTTHTSLYIEYVNGVHTIQVIGSASVPEYPRIVVEPASIAFSQSYPIDYPALLNETVVTNDGNGSLTVESIDLTLNEEDAYSIRGVYREGLMGALLPVDPPFELGPGSSAYIRVHFHPIDVERYAGILEILSNDPENPQVQVALSGAGTTASGVTTLIVQTGPSGEEGRWVVPIDLGPQTHIVESKIVHAYNVFHYAVDPTDDDHGVILEGELVHPDMPGQIILEVTALEILGVLEVIIDPDLEAPETLPDLIITDIWRDGTEICYQILNKGGGNAPPGSITHLHVDGTLMGSQVVSVQLGPGERFYGEFRQSWPVLACPEGMLSIGVAADAAGQITESGEHNNKREESWKCDQDPPEFLKPPVASASHTSAIITWETDEPSDSEVFIDDRKPVKSREVRDPSYVILHSIHVGGLDPSKGYAFYVQSTDTSNNTIRSDTQTFFTQPFEDLALPTFGVLEKVGVGGVEMIRANVTDDVGIHMVQFYVDGHLLGVDYAYPFEVPWDPLEFEEGDHDVVAEAFDLYGNSALASDRIPLEEASYDNPIIVIRNPREGDTINGTCPVQVIASDPDGMDTLEIYLDTDRVFSVSGIPSTIIGFGGAILPSKGDLVEESLNVTYPMDTLDWDNGPHTLRVRGWDLFGNATEWLLNITIFNAVPRLHPHLLVTRPPAELQERPGAGPPPAGLVVIVAVENTGEAPATNITIEDVLHGFYPTGSFITTPRSDAILEPGFAPSTSTTWCTISIPELGPGEALTMRYAVIPILQQTHPYTYSIGETVRIGYNGTQGDTYSETTSITVGPVLVVMDSPPLHLATGGIVPLSDPSSADALDACLHTSDYLIVTCPAHMWTLPGEMALLIQSMARLAWLKRGALGFLSSDDADEMRANLCELIWEGGRWSDRLDPDYPSEGYLLIVGETNIVPSFDHGRFNVRWEDPDTERNVDHCDTDYADSNGDWNPEIIVGRIIGESAAALRRPIDASIMVAEGTMEFDTGSALLISGIGDNSQAFRDDVNQISIYLRDLVDSYRRTVLHMNQYLDLHTYYRDFALEDRLIVGNVQGDDLSEIMIVRADEDIIEIYNHRGVRIGERSFAAEDDWVVRFAESQPPERGQIAFMIPDQDRIWKIWADTPESGFTTTTPVSGYFDLAAGDVDGDLHHFTEYVVASAEDNMIYISRGTPFFFAFTEHDRIAVGNVMGDAKEEIIIARDDDNRIFIYDNTGTQLAVITSMDITYFTPHDQLAVGDVCGDGYDEIVIAMDDTGRITAYNTTGHRVGYVDLGFTRNDDLCLGDLEGSSKEEIIIARDDDGDIITADLEWANRIRDDIQSLSAGKDVIVFRGHGNVDNWNVFRTLDVPPDFGSATPFVLALTCLSGNYEEGGIAERFLERGAGAYIGSTQVSPTTQNGWALEEFFEAWCDTDRTLGEAFKELERDLRRQFSGPWDGDFGEFWVAEYNFYGDPKYGKIDHPPDLGSPANSDSNDPPQEISITIPQLQINSTQTHDLLSIPGGGHTMETGMPQLPTYFQAIPIPVGWEVEDVLLTGKSDAQIWENMRIPMAVVSNDTLGTLSHITTHSGYAGYVESSEATYPTTEYSWAVMDGDAGQRDLVINIIPASINVNTARLRFWDEYNFQVRYSPSLVRITEMDTDSPSYRPGNEVTIQIGLEASIQEDVEVVLEGVIRDDTGEVVEGLPLQGLLVSGPTYTSCTWETQDAEPGGYAAEILLRGSEGTLDVGTIRFWIRGPEAGISQVVVESSDDSVEVTIEITSEEKADGEAMIWISDTDGVKINEQVLDISTIPHLPISIKTSFSLQGLEEGEYLIVASAILDGVPLGMSQASFTMPEGLVASLLALLLVGRWLGERGHGGGDDDGDGLGDP